MSFEAVKTDIVPLPRLARYDVGFGKCWLRHSKNHKARLCPSPDSDRDYCVICYRPDRKQWDFLDCDAHRLFPETQPPEQPNQ